MTEIQKPKLLLVDDNLDNLIALEVLLSDLNVEFIRALSGNEALTQIISHEFALAIIDFQMPDMDGFETVELLRQEEKTKTLPVLFVSAIYQEEIKLIKSIESGAVDFIPKPIIPVILIGKVKIFLDLYNQRKNLERYNQKLQEIHHQYQQTIENAHGILYKFNYNTKSYEFIGEGYKELFGITSPSIPLDEFTGMRKELFCITPVEFEDCKSFHDAFLEGKIQHYQADLKIITPDGITKWINDSSIPIIDSKSGKVTKALGIMQDITERKKIERQLRQSQKMEAIGRLAGGVAHDFNNMLTVIRGYSELLLNRFDKSDPIHAKISQIDKSAERTQQLTQQLLAFSRQQSLLPKVVNINKIIKNMKNMLIRLIGEDVKLRTNLSLTIGNIKVDSGQIEQIIMNLVINARDAMPDGGNIVISTKNFTVDNNFTISHDGLNEGNYIQISINDAGIGMSKEIQNKIFEPFFTTKGVEKGTGLGLSTVYGIVKQSNGYIWVESEPGAGSTFHILFPHIKEKIEKLKKTKVKPKKVNGKETILLVEDELDVRSLVRESLQFYGYHILETENGKKALELTNKTNDDIDLVLTDLIMPEMSGIELAKKLRASNPDIKILFMSGYSDKAEFNKDELDKNSGYIGKPFSPQDIAQKIREILDV